MAELELEHMDGTVAFEPGGSERFRVSWRLDAIPEALELRLYWFTSGRGDQDGGEHDVWVLTPEATEGESLVTVELPHVPHSFDGKLIAIHWELEAVALPGKRHVTLPLVIAPGGEVLRGADAT